MALSAIYGLGYVTGHEWRTVPAVNAWLSGAGSELARPVTDRFGKVGSNPRMRIDLGYEYLTSRKIRKTTAIPDEIAALGEEIRQLLVGGGIETPPFDQCLINIYARMQGIGAHIDDPELFGPVIACLNLAGSRVMRFTQDEYSHDLHLRDGDLYFMTEEARYGWKHEMPRLPTNEACFSITFRTMRH